MSQVSEQYDFNIPIFRKVCLPKRVAITTLTYAPLVSFILGTITLAAHTILFPYYVLVILARGRPPKALYLWVCFNSAYIYGAIHEDKEVWYDFWCLYYVYFGYIFGFINWILTTVSIALIFPIFIYIEEWSLLINTTYRITFGNWKTLTNRCPEMRYKKSMKDQKRKEQKQKEKSKFRKAKKKGEIHDADYQIVKVKDDSSQKGKLVICSVCGAENTAGSTYCIKCGSYIGK
ncbi:MAG: zinc ribbon domain-containing protein [Asgard group archaeon]|nr:zinc ribbon domain-containing protein [Asgard group archaeon]